MPNIAKRKDGRYCGAIDLGSVNGKRKRKYVYGRTRKEVVDKLAKLHIDQALGLNIAPEQITVAAFLDTWLDTVKMSRRPRTYETYNVRIRTHITPHIGSKRLADVTALHIQSLLTQLSRQKLAPATIRQVRAILNRSFGYAVKWGYLSRNVVALTDTPQVEKYALTPLSHEQIQRLLDVVRGHKLEAVYRVAISLGLRRGEVLGLRLQDIDFDQAVLHVRVSLQRFGGNLELVPPKTKSSMRTLPLLPTLLEALKVHKARREAEKLKCGDTWIETGVFFTTHNGKPIEPRNLLHHFKAALKRAGLPKTIRFHDLRHATASYLIAQNVHAKIISAILGHSNISITMDLYGHLLSGIERDALKTLDGLWGPKEKKD